jgi:hypothetical protein
VIHKTWVVGCPAGYSIPPEKSLCSNPNGLPTSRGFFVLTKKKGSPVQQDDEIILRYSKEIIIKFIELGRISPGSFGDHFRTIYWSLKNTVVEARLPKLDEKFFDGDHAEDS